MQSKLYIELGFQNGFPTKAKNEHWNAFSSFYLEISVENRSKFSNSNFVFRNEIQSSRLSVFKSVALLITETMST